MPSFLTRRCWERSGHSSAPVIRRSSSSAAAAARSSPRSCRVSTIRRSPPPTQHEPAGQLRLFEAVLELLDLLGEFQPVVLILEDMHWADRSTRTFAAFLARSLREERVMMLLDLPQRRASPPSCAAPAAGRARSPRARAAHRACAVRPRRADRGARRHPRRRAQPRAGRARVQAQRGQPAVHRGAAGGRPRRSRRHAAEPARRVHAADRAPVRRGPARRPDHRRRPGSRTSR